jgi:AcrR family transcriptional regulator
MARSSKSGPRPGNGKRQARAAKADAPASEAERLFAAAMEVAERIGWRRASLADIADGAGLTLAALHGKFRDKAAILAGLAEHADRAVLEGVAAEKPSAAGETARDRLFDVLMRRFEALKPYRRGLAEIAREGGGGGVLDAVCGVQRVLNSLAWMAEAAGVSSAGWGGAVRVKGLGVVYAATFPTWLKDDSEDLAKTMAALDKNLKRCESLLNTFSFRRAGAGGGGPAEAAEGPAKA